MFRTRILCLAAAISCCLGLAVAASALEVDCDTTYCFSPEDFGSDELTGICITGLPDADAGTAMLGSRVLQCGDILTADQLAQVTFCPLRTESDTDAVLTYLPIYENRVEKSTTVTLSIRGKENQAPVAQDSFLETYKNLANSGSLKVTDPEGESLTYSVVRQPKRGTVAVNADGTFTYTPKKNKVGVDSFVFTATDSAGNVSREATVTVRILKPSDSTQYTDTAGSDCRFEAEWLKNTGVFVGEQLGGRLCFQENKTVTRGEFLAMAVKTLGLTVEEDAVYTGYTDEIPQWLKPYLAAAVRSGMTTGLPEAETFGADVAITGAEAAVMLQNVLDLSVSTGAEENEEIPAWAADAVSAMNESGLEIAALENMTRGQAAKLLYQISCIAGDAPGMQIYQ